MEAIAAFRAAWEAGDLDRLVDTLAADVEFVSPLVARGVVRGKHDLRLLLGELLVGLSQVRWTGQIVDGDRGVLLAKGRMGPFGIDNAMVVELDRDGRIQRLSPHLRPYLATTWFGFAMSRRLARHPGLLWRAGRRR